VHNVLEDTLQVILVNARHVKNVPGRKTDISDSMWLANLLRKVPPIHVSRLYPIFLAKPDQEYCHSIAVVHSFINEENPRYRYSISGAKNHNSCNYCFGAPTIL
jgi:hypothetical protein